MTISTYPCISVPKMWHVAKIWQGWQLYSSSGKTCKKGAVADIQALGLGTSGHECAKAKIYVRRVAVTSAGFVSTSMYQRVDHNPVVRKHMVQKNCHPESGILPIESYIPSTAEEASRSVIVCSLPACAPSQHILPPPQVQQEQLIT